MVSGAKSNSRRKKAGAMRTLGVIALILSMYFTGRNISTVTTKSSATTNANIGDGQKSASYQNLDVSVSNNITQPTALAQENKLFLLEQRTRMSTSVVTENTNETFRISTSTLGTNETLHRMYSHRHRCERKFFKAPLKLVEHSMTLLVLKKDPVRPTTPTPTPTSTIGAADQAAICVLQKNEEWHLEEWINYHLAYGFDHIYVFCDDMDGRSTSTSGSNDTTSKQHQHPIPTPNDSTDRVHFLPVTPELFPKNGIHKQAAVYNACVEIIRRRQHHERKEQNQEQYSPNTWVALMDMDEFLVLKRHEGVKDFMAEYCPKPYCGSVGINWLWFGTSNQTYHSNKPVTQRFQYRHTQASPVVKSIFRLEDFYCATNAHFVHLTIDPMSHPNQPPFPYDTHGTPHFRGPTSPAPFLDVAAFHHYTKSLEEWYVRRCIRGDAQAAHNLKCTGVYPEAGSYHDASAARFYQTQVLDKFPLLQTRWAMSGSSMDAHNSASIGTSISTTAVDSTAPPFWFNRTLEWVHNSESDFGIQERVPLSKMFNEIRGRNKTVGQGTISTL